MLNVVFFGEKQSGVDPVFLKKVQFLSLYVQKSNLPLTTHFQVLTIIFWD